MESCWSSVYGAPATFWGCCYKVSLGLCLQSVLPDNSPMMADGGTCQALLPELPHTTGPPAAGSWPSSTAAGDVLGLVWPCLLLPACLIVLSYAPACSCPVVLVPQGCIEFSIITIYSADAMQNSQWGWARWTQLNKNTAIIPGGWLEPRDTSAISCGFYVGRHRFQPLESSYPTDNN